MKKETANKKFGYFWVIGILLFPCLSLAGDMDSVEIQLVDYGIYRVLKGKIIDEPQMPHGQIRELRTSELLEQTERIPARLGTVFGIRIRIKGLRKENELKITLKMIHPELRKEYTGKPFYGYEQEFNIEKGRIEDCFYEFTYPWELVEGVWTFQIYHEDKKFINKSFMVSNP